MVESSKRKEEKMRAPLVKLLAYDVKIMQNNYTRNVMSYSINWDDEDLNIPADLKQIIIEELGFFKLSKIQAVAIRLIIGEMDKNVCDLIAENKNGWDNKDAFSIGTAMRVDRKILKP